MIPTRGRLCSIGGLELQLQSEDGPAIRARNVALAQEYLGPFRDVVIPVKIEYRIPQIIQPGFGAGVSGIERRKSAQL
jgi:hypothetical protein